MTQHTFVVSVTEQPDVPVLAAWDALVTGVQVGDVTQLSSWASIRARVGYRPLYLLAFDSTELIGGAQILHRRVPLVGLVGYCAYGPLVGTVDRRSDVRAALCSALERLGGQFTMLFVQPPENADDVAEDLLDRGFRPSDAGIAPAATLRVDLTASEEELRGNLSRRLRGWTRQWRQRGVTVRRGDESDIGLLTDLTACTAKHQGFEPFSQDYLGALFRELATGGHAAVFVGEVAGRPVAADMLTSCGHTVKRRLVGLDRSNETMRLNVAGAIVWESMLWAKRQGYRYFDFSGVMPDSVHKLTTDGVLDPEALNGADRFKARFGAKLYRYPTSVELITSPLVRSVYDLSRRYPTGRRLVGTAKRLLRGAG